MVVVGALQHMSLSTMKQARIALAYEDTLVRADGLVQMVHSRWKKRVSTGLETIDVPRGGSETGSWDGHAFALGWERLPPEGEPARARAALWVRFLDGRPAFTFRYDVSLKVPCLLEPRLLDVVGVGTDDVDPA